MAEGEMGVGGLWVGGTGLWHRVDECTNELSDVTSTMSMWLTRVMYLGVPAAEEVHGRRGCAGLVVISIDFTPGLRDWGALLGPVGTLMSPWLAG
jgi:hypothetical protein